MDDVQTKLLRLWRGEKAKQKKRLRKRVKKSKQQLTRLGEGMGDVWFGDRKTKKQQSGGNINVGRKNPINNIRVIYQYHQ